MENNTLTVTNVTFKQSQRKRRKQRPSNLELARRLDELERTYNEQLEIVVEAIRKLMRAPVRKRKPIGFRAKLPKK
jgi:hypothetical protein